MVQMSLIYFKLNFISFFSTQNHTELPTERENEKETEPLDGGSLVRVMLLLLHSTEHFQVLH